MKDPGRILVVDDEALVRDALASWLEEDGYQVDTAPDGQTALATLGRQAYAILLVDLKMPGIGGLEVLSQARAMQPQAAVILMTAYATVETAVQAMKQGAHDYLMKPFDPEQLSNMVADLLESQILRRENVLEHAAPWARGPALTPPGVDLAAATPPAAAEPTADGTASKSLRDMERKHIAEILKLHDWNISRSARALEIDRVTLYNKIRKYQIREDE